MPIVIFDASPLMTACKFEAQRTLVIDQLRSGCRRVIAPIVEEEVAVLGAGYPDDSLAFVAATRRGLKAWMLPDLVVELAERGSLTAEIAKTVLETIRSRDRVGVIELLPILNV